MSNVCNRASSLEAESLDIVLGRSTIFIGYLLQISLMLLESVET